MKLALGTYAAFEIEIFGGGGGQLWFFNDGGV